MNEYINFDWFLNNAQPKDLAMIIGCLAMIIIVLVFSSISKKSSVNSIKLRRAGDNQHGSARWATRRELKKTGCKVYKLPKTIVDMSSKWDPGRIVDFNPRSRKIYIDTTRTHAEFPAPTRRGKTTISVIPNLQINMMAGSSFIITDIKGEIRRVLYKDFERLGYKIHIIDFMNPAQSSTFDLFDQINENIEKYNRTNNLLAKDKAENLARKLAEEIVSSRQRGTSENSFFVTSSKSLIASVILLISQFAEPEEKHFASVNNVIYGLQAMSSHKQTGISFLLNQLPYDNPAKKLVGAAAPAPPETEANIYSSVLTDLAPFTNSLAEQIITPNAAKQINVKSIVDEKTVVFLNLPETETEMFMFAKLFVKMIYNQLTEYAASFPTGVLPRTVKLVLEEIGLWPKIDKMKDMLPIASGRGMLFDLIYQAVEQLHVVYGKEETEIILKQCGISVFIGFDPKDVTTADRVSKMLGSYTALSGSTSINYSAKGLEANNSSGITDQLVARPLLTVDEILHLPVNEKILIRANFYPYKPKLYPYYSKEWGLPYEFTEFKIEDFTNYSEVKLATAQGLRKAIDEQYQVSVEEISKKLMEGKGDKINIPEELQDLPDKILDMIRVAISEKNIERLQTILKDCKIHAVKRKRLIDQMFGIEG